MKIAVLAEQNFNLIDGSTIWLLNMCKLLALQPDFEITLLLSHALKNRTLADELPKSITVVDAADMALLTGRMDVQMTAATLMPTLEQWEAVQGPVDRFFVRGTGYIEQLLMSKPYQSRVVGYAPSVIPDLAASLPKWVDLGRTARMPVVVQSEVAGRALESLYDYPANLVHVVPPIVFPSKVPARRADTPATLCYAGKIDLHYGIDWLMDIGRAVADEPDLAVSIIAGKDTYRARFAAFFKQMDSFRAAITEGQLPAVSLVTDVAHQEAKARMAGADFAYCLRHTRYDDVIEISTKIVEFCTLGVPPILNDNALNRSLFGDDYPYFIDPVAEDVVARVPELMRGRNSPDHARAKARIAEVAAAYSADNLAHHLGRALRGYELGLPILAKGPRNILIATHERKFLARFLDRLRGEANISIMWEPWATTTKPEAAPHVPDGVDTVLCEWCCENAVWHSHNKRAGTKLIVRLHRFEAYRDFPGRVNWDNVDALIVVSDHFRDLMIGQYGLDAAKIHVWPQYIDWHRLQRDKLPEAQFTLGLVGINPFEHKRFDRAIAFFKALQARDPRFKLAVRSVMPWQIDWVWNNREDAREQFKAVFDQIAGDPNLKHAVRFDPPGPDMEEWFRGVGAIISSSDSEGCHTSVIEGMAAGCLPIVYNWPGARSLFDPHVYEDLTDAVADVIAFADARDANKTRQDLIKRVQVHDIETFTQAFMQL